MVPDGFKFAIKASRFCTNRKDARRRRRRRSAGSARRASPSSATSSGPILWQLAPTKKFDRRRDPRLPGAAADQPRRHRAAPCARGAARKLPLPRVRRRSPAPRSVAIVFADQRRPIPQIADLTADFVYARLQQTREEEPDGYSAAALDRWAAGRARLGGRREPDGPRLCQRRAGAERSRARSSPSSSAAPRSAIRPPPRR